MQAVWVLVVAASYRVTRRSSPRRPGPPRSCRQRSRGAPGSAAVLRGSGRVAGQRVGPLGLGGSSSTASRAELVRDARRASFAQRRTRCRSRARRAGAARARANRSSSTTPADTAAAVVSSISRRRDARAFQPRLQLVRGQVAAGERSARHRAFACARRSSVRTRRRVGRSSVEPRREPRAHHDLVGHGAPGLSVDFERDPAGAGAR